MNEKKDVSVVAALDPNTQNQLRRQLDDLTVEFAGIFSRETIERFVDESTEALARARFHDYVPVLVYRFARERPRALGQAEGVIAKEVPEVLFVCVHNAGRSQMAAGLLRASGGGLILVRSAGTAPGERVNPMAVQAMREIGIDISAASPSRLTTDDLAAADVCITIGCGDTCPLVPGTEYRDWPVDDPSGQPIEVVRRVRDDIAERVQALVAELAPDAAG